MFVQNVCPSLCPSNVAPYFLDILMKFDKAKRKTKRNFILRKETSANNSD